MGGWGGGGETPTYKAGNDQRGLSISLRRVMLGVPNVAKIDWTLFSGQRLFFRAQMRPTSVARVTPLDAIFHDPGGGGGRMQRAGPAAHHSGGWGLDFSLR